MGISRKDEDLLLWFFERGVTTFWRSPFGATLERAHALAYDSEGHRIEKSDPWSSGSKLRMREYHREASYEPDDVDLLRVAHVSRRLRRANEIDPGAEETLESYYGRLGARWARTDEGRVFALYPLTPAGGAFVRADLARRPNSNADPHERLLEEVQVQRVSPTPERREQLARIHAQAEKRLAAGWHAWCATEARPAVASAP